jgi:hypothetical protein
MKRANGDEFRLWVNDSPTLSVASGISIPPVELGSDEDTLIPLEMDPPQHAQ